MQRFVGPNGSGTIENIFCDVDTQVRKDQLCAKIDPRPYQDAVDLSKANLAIAQAQLGGTRAVSLIQRSSSNAMSGSGNSRRLGIGAD